MDKSKHLKKKPSLNHYFLFVCKAFKQVPRFPFFESFMIRLVLNKVKLCTLPKIYIIIPICLIVDLGWDNDGEPENQVPMKSLNLGERFYKVLAFPQDMYKYECI